MKAYLLLVVISAVVAYCLANQNSVPASKSEMGGVTNCTAVQQICCNYRGCPKPNPTYMGICIASGTCPKSWKGCYFDTQFFVYDCTKCEANCNS